ncbi:amidase [Paracoccus aurantiacus]|uniref:Amidase n=1 Tax=Paracoccus aurantiacus TaxID=2599412 RepID=A0A5C6S5T1_9RHOB|nr:amidase [Paracoccus aurantiacus]TXB69351.1 amidase [Paracoccus aurantiacus]
MNPADRPIPEIASQLRDRRLRVPDLIEAHLDRIAARNPTLSALVGVDADAARQAAVNAERDLRAGDDRGPLHGIPFAVKDLIDIEGQSKTCGSRRFADRVATADAAVITRLRAAGAIPIARAATYEFALTGPSFDAAYPPSLNPWSADHITGGSSSGSASAVAGGMLRLALGTDTGGSVRSPAAYCGIVGLKPTYGLVPMGGVFRLSPSLDHLGPMAASVAEAALMLDAMAPGCGAAAALGHDIKGLRIGYARDWFAHDPDAARDLVAAVDDAASALSMLGAEITLVRMPDYALAESAGAVILHSEALEIHRDGLTDSFDLYGRQPRQSLAGGVGLTAEDVARAQAAGHRISAAIDALLDECDVILAPTTLAPAPPVAAFRGDETVWTVMRTLPFNLTGHPAMSVPIGFSEGLPLGMQIVGARRAEAMICRIGAAFEAATDHSAQRPYFA